MLKKQLLILLCIFWAKKTSCLIGDLVAAVNAGWMITEHLEKIKSGNDTVEIMNQLQMIDHKLDDSKMLTRGKKHYMELLIEQLPAESAIQSKKNTLVSFILAVNLLWKKLPSYMERDATRKMFDDLADDILASLKSQLEEFRHAIIPSSSNITSSRDGLFMLLIENADKKRDILCDLGRTSHHEILNLFHIAISTEIKAYSLLFFAHLLKYSENDGWKVPLEKKFKEQIHKSIDVLSNSLKAAKLPYIRSCDPDVWRLGKNYYALYGYLQQTIYHVHKCSDNGSLLCKQLNDAAQGIDSARYKYLITRGIYPQDGEIYREKCPMVPLSLHAYCDGRPFNCEDMMSLSTDVWTCASEDGPYKIRYIKHLSKFYGPDKTSIATVAKNGKPHCHPDVSHNTYASDIDPQGQRICSCQCSESRIGLIVAMLRSRISDNHIIVGLRIRQLINYLYIEIAEGKLEADGYIANSSWINPTRDISFEPYSGQFVKANSNYHLFFLADIQLPPGFALTGIRFSRLRIGEIRGFAICLKGLKFDYETGKLDGFLDAYECVERESNHELTIPTRTPFNMAIYKLSSPKSDEYTHVKLQRSDLSDDYGQTTLPLIDGVSILTEPLSPIGGVGLFYKGYAEDYAGFLSLRMYPVNFTYFIETFKELHDIDSILNWNH